MLAWGGWGGGYVRGAGKGVGGEKKAPQFKERNISSEMESYCVIIQNALIQTQSVGLLNQSITMCLSGYKYSSD